DGDCNVGTYYSHIVGEQTKQSTNYLENPHQPPRPRESKGEAHCTGCFASWATSRPSLRTPFHSTLADLLATTRLIFRATLTNMNAHLYEELEHLSIAERRSLGEALIVSAESEASASLITEAQRTELRSRLAYHRANPDEPGVTFSQLKAKLLATPR
ncbi:MAG: addiction module protein, partial [Sulfurimicrobium sp.]|nr:addiction module protein [Sulfurimicrobium sp.]